MDEKEEFNTLAFEKRLTQLKDTQESIQSLSNWCLKQRDHHKKIVSSWLNVLKRVKVEQRLVLFYLANDVIQYSKRKNYEFVESWGLNLQKATPLVRDEKVRNKILRIFKIWEQRSVYDEEFLSDLTGLLSAGAVKKTDDESLDFQPQQLINKIKQCSVLEADTDLRLKHIHESELQLSDSDALRASLKERSNKEDIEKDLNEGIAVVERYTQALQREIVAREALLELLSSANQYYSTQRGEVKVVAYAYKNFGARVRALKRKLDELIPTLPGRMPSPPQRDEDVPSPGPDEDLDLPTNAEDDVSYNIDKTFNTSLSADGSLYNLGLSSFLNNDNRLSMFNDSSDQVTDNGNKIEVINSRPTEKEDFDINNFLKTLVPNDSNVIAQDNISIASGTLSDTQRSQDTLPGLDLLTPESSGNPPPPTSFYGSVVEINDEPEPPYHPEPTSPWSSTTSKTTWSIPPAPVPPPVVLHAAPPASPPAMPHPPQPPIMTYQDAQTADVDQRGAIPPPPMPPVIPTLSILGTMEDVDHRLLPTLPPPPVPPPIRHTSSNKDVDHRNLISLTHQPPTQITQPSRGGDQDYRIPTMVPPPDIVESVDMDLSEDEEQAQSVYSSQASSEHRRNSFNQNNKVLVGGDNGELQNDHKNLIRINSLPNNETQYKEKINTPTSAPIVQPIINPFEKMPDVLKNFNAVFRMDPRSNTKVEDVFNKTEESRIDGSYPKDSMNTSPSEFEDILNEDTLSRPPPNVAPMSPNMPPMMPNFMPNMDMNFGPNMDPNFMMNNQRFPRNWNPRTNFRPPGFGQQFWPRNGPRPPRSWNGPRPQRFW